VVKILEKSLRILFETRDVSRVKLYVQRQFQKISSGRTSLMDLTFAKEFRGMDGYRPGACVPALELSRRAATADRRAVPCRGQRVPYVVVYGQPGTPLIQSVRTPHEVLADPNARPNGQYYATKVVAPSLQRCFSLLGADVMEWYREMPKDKRGSRLLRIDTGARKGQEGSISRFFVSGQCVVCSAPARRTLCDRCAASPARAAVTLSERVRKWDTSAFKAASICRSCCGFDTGAAGMSQSKATAACTSLDCPILYGRREAALDAAQIPAVQQLLQRDLF